MVLTHWNKLGATNSVLNSVWLTPLIRDTGAGSKERRTIFQERKVERAPLKFEERKVKYHSYEFQ